MRAKDLEPCAELQLSTARVLPLRCARSKHRPHLQVADYRLLLQVHIRLALLESAAFYTLLYRHGFEHINLTIFSTTRCRVVFIKAKVFILQIIFYIVQLQRWRRTNVLLQFLPLRGADYLRIYSISDLHVLIALVNENDKARKTIQVLENVFKYNYMTTIVSQRYATKCSPR